MRTAMKLSIASLALAAGLAACGRPRASDVAQDDFKRDLQLASTNLDLASAKVDPSLLNSLETKPKGAPAPAPTVKQAAGNRAVQSKSPTVRATPETDVSELDESDATESMAEAPAPVSTNEPVAVAPRPAPVNIPSGGDYGTGGGGVFGGVVIRGGGVDGDHCEIHTGRGRPATMPRGPVFFPNPAAPRSGGGVSIGSRDPGRLGGAAPTRQTGGGIRGSGIGSRIR